MRCPVDGSTLALAEHHGVEIDYCPQCLGMWLDRGELERIIEHAGGRGDERGYRPRDEHERHHHDDDRHHHDDDHDRRWGSEHGHDDRRRGRKRGGAFGALSDLLGGGGD